ncbi:hypothetical protein ALC62_03007 [Cyphomyrmex costatus]|uniref:Nuclease HARBI1 n=1 Tax=Cyphomyrmex costatus TaxID=456900 RepID=A0A151IMD8_9HYME|nr:hypothetical protein ALC62_12360 [Cyphomyrmex costatus]KYN06055.1 hypothetical protein ALC62_03007 [Cyphomyrmex costatus]
MRESFGAHRRLFSYFQKTDHEEFFKFTRMTPHQFDILHGLLKKYLEKKSFRESLPTDLRIAVTLSFLAHGDSITSLSNLYRIGKSTIYSIIPEVCTIIWNVLQPIYLKSEIREREWLEIADDFLKIWNFPNCLGAIDGKHIRIWAPSNSGSAFHNYKSKTNVKNER